MPHNPSRGGSGVLMCGDSLTVTLIRHSRTKNAELPTWKDGFSELRRLGGRVDRAGDVMEQTKKLIKAVVAGKIDTAWGKELRKAVDEANNCAKIAAFVAHVIYAAQQDGDHDPAPMLVHGIVETSPYDAPKFHAWAEVEEIVIDLTLPPPVQFTSKDHYYALKGIETTRRYSSEDISINLVRHGHYGPWDDEAFPAQSLFR